MDLQRTIGDSNATEQQVREQVTIVPPRQKAKLEAQAAQKDLLRVLTFDQEAILVSLGVIE